MLKEIYTEGLPLYLLDQINSKPKPLPPEKKPIIDIQKIKKELKTNKENNNKPSIIPKNIEIMKIFTPSSIDISNPDIVHLKTLISSQNNTDRSQKTNYIQTNHLTILNGFIPSTFLEKLILVPNSTTILHYTPHIKNEAIKKVQTRKKRINQAKMEQSNQLEIDTELYLKKANADNLELSLLSGNSNLLSLNILHKIQNEDVTKLKALNTQLSEQLKVSNIKLNPTTFSQLKSFQDTTFVSNIDIEDYYPNIATSQDLASLIFYPFKSIKQNQKGILQGTELQSNNIILKNIWDYNNYNSLIAGTSGSGKSYTVKLDLLRNYAQGVDIIGIDPENEMRRVTEAVNGEYIDFSLSSKGVKINIFDMPEVRKYDEELSDEDIYELEDIMRSKILTIEQGVKLMLKTEGAKDVLNQYGHLIEPAIRASYSSIGVDVNDVFTYGILIEQSPNLKTFITQINQNKNGEYISEKLVKYTEGVLKNLFSDETTNFEFQSWTIFGIRSVDEVYRPLVMYLITMFIKNNIYAIKKPRILAIDECGNLMNTPETVGFIADLVSRARKYYLSVMLINQYIDIFFKTIKTDNQEVSYGNQIMNNISRKFLMSQSNAEAINEISKFFSLSSEDTRFLFDISSSRINNSNTGKGLLITPDDIAIQLKVIAANHEHILITTNPQET